MKGEREGGREGWEDTCIKLTGRRVGGRNNMQSTQSSE